MTETSQVRLVVSEEKLASWDEFWESNPEYSSRSDLIRSAVAHEMADQGGTGGSIGTSQLEIQMGDMMDKMDEMLQRFDSLDRRLQSLESEAHKDPEIQKLTNEVLAALPTYEEFEEFDEHPLGFNGYAHEVEGAITPEGKADFTQMSTAVSGRVVDLAKVIDASQYKVQEAVDKLQEETYLIREVERDGEVRYIKEA
jgi:hypothetical protein